jgi:hypothetical protein
MIGAERGATACSRNVVYGILAAAISSQAEQSKLNRGIQFDGVLLWKRQLGADTNLRMSNDANRACNR